MPGLTALRLSLVVLLLLGGLYAWLSARRPARPDAMRFLEHAEELRRRLLLVAGAFLVGTTFAFGFRLEPWRGFFRPVPALGDNLAAQVYGTLADTFVPSSVTLMVSGPLDGFMAEFSVALGIGAVVALPTLLVQLIGFIDPALRPHERRMLRALLLPALSLFVAGVAFAAWFVLPFLFVTLYAYAADVGAGREVALFLHVQDFVSFSFGLMLVFGAAFQTPLVMAATSRVGVVSSRWWIGHWRHAIIVILVVSALVTDPTILSQLLVAAPLFGLYLVGALVARLVEP